MANPVLDSMLLAFSIIDTIILLALLGFEFYLSLVNYFGFAWWGVIETREPNITYWYGPFLTKKALQVNLPEFMSDIRSENPSFISHKFLQCAATDELTISSEKLVNLIELKAIKQEGILS